MSFLGIEGKYFVVMGVANKKSVAYHIARGLEAEGAVPILSVRDQETRERVSKLFPDRKVLLCDVENDGSIAGFASAVAAAGPRIHGLVHSIAFADYSEGIRPFHETGRRAFLQAVDISCYSLIRVSDALRELFDPDASVVTVSISTTTMAAESYGFMAPVKAALDSSIVFLAKSFSAFSRVRFNSVRAGLLKTSSSAGIPGYIDYYLFAETATLRKRALETTEAADAALFLLSPRSSGINAQGIVVDAGMAANYFDREIITRVSREG